MSGFKINTVDAKAVDIYNMWKDTNVVSLNILNHLHIGDELPADYYNAICKVIDTLPEEGFDIRPIHDEFACLPRFANSMRKQFNQLISELYQSNLLDYFCNQFELLDIKPMNDVNPEMVERILEADYLLS